MTVSENKYLKAYQDMSLVEGKGRSNNEEAAQVIRQLGLMYNAMGEVIKDFIKLIQPHYQSQEIGVQCVQEHSLIEQNSHAMEVEQTVELNAFKEKAGEFRDSPSNKKSIRPQFGQVEVVDLDGDSSLSIKPSTVPMDSLQPVAQMQIQIHGIGPKPGMAVWENELFPELRRNMPVKKNRMEQKASIIEID